MDDEEVEVSTLRGNNGRARGLRVHPPAGSSRRRRRMRRIALFACTLLLAILALASSLRSSGGFAVLPFPTATPRPIATEIPAIVVASTTATAQAQAFPLLEQRTLYLPTVAPGSPCPLSPRQQVKSAYGPAAGEGPVYFIENLDGPFLYSDAAYFRSGGSAWGGATSLFIIAPTYTGVALIRGRQIDGPHELRFNGGIDRRDEQGDLWTAPLLAELKLADNGLRSPWFNSLDILRLQAPGCYALQIDGLTFSEVIVFQAVVLP